MTVSLILGDRVHVGWTAATVTRSLETISGRFDLTLSEREPGETTPRVIRAGDRCQVALGNDLVITGWVDEAAVEYDSASHVVSVRGRDTTGDLVDCSAATQPGEWRDARLEEIATALCQPFGIDVSRETDTGEPFARFRIEEGESVFEAIDRACRFRAVLPQSDGTGGLILGGPSRDRASVRLERGVNILAGSARSSWLSRYSDYSLKGQQAGGLDGFTAEQVAHVSATARDPGVNRYRPLTIIGEQSQAEAEAQARVQWEANVRAARARSAGYTVQGWTEVPDGALWRPGRLVHVVDDWSGLDAELLISATTQSLSASGTLTDLDLVQPDAFAQRAEPESTSLGSSWWGPAAP